METYEPCPADAVCLTEISAISIGIWVRSVIDYYTESKTCPNLKERP